MSQVAGAWLSVVHVPGEEEKVRTLNSCAWPGIHAAQLVQIKR